MTDTTLSPDRRRVVHFNVTAHPTAQWTVQQIVEAFPFDSTPKYLVGDNDGIYGRAFQHRLTQLGIEEAPITSRSPCRTLTSNNSSARSVANASIM